MLKWCSVEKEDERVTRSKYKLENSINFFMTAKKKKNPKQTMIKHTLSVFSFWSFSLLA